MQRLRILVVDDEPVVLRALGRLLGDEFDVVTAGDAEEALRCIESASFDAIVSDYDMPGMDGISLLEALRKKRPAVRRVLVSGSDLEEIDVSVGLVDAFFKKPFDITELRRALVIN